MVVDSYEFWSISYGNQTELKLKGIPNFAFDKLLIILDLDLFIGFDSVKKFMIFFSLTGYDNKTIEVWFYQEIYDILSLAGDRNHRDFSEVILDLKISQIRFQVVKSDFR